MAQKRQARTSPNSSAPVYWDVLGSTVRSLLKDRQCSEKSKMYYYKFIVTIMQSNQFHNTSHYYCTKAIAQPKRIRGNKFPTVTSLA
jgi:hypothetical protein